MKLERRLASRGACIAIRCRRDPCLPGMRRSSRASSQRRRRPTGADLGAIAGAARPGRPQRHRHDPRHHAMGPAGRLRRSQAASTPNLDRLAARACCSSRRSRSVPLTLPAHSTLFTGLLPPRHGVRDNGGYVLDPKHTHARDRCSKPKEVADRRIRRRVRARLEVGPEPGASTPTSTSSTSRSTSRCRSADVARRADEVVDNAMPWLEQHADQQFFAWLHFYDAHTPYDPPEPFKLALPIDAAMPARSRTSTTQVGRVLQWLDTQRPRGADDRRRDRRSRREPERAPARARTASSSTTPPCASRSSSGRRSPR